MPFCTQCKRYYSGDIGYCPYCKSPLVRQKREGFKIEEVPEFFARKLGAVADVVLGFLSIPLFAYIGWMYGGVFGGLLGFFIGLITFALSYEYASRYWRKVDHIMWTRQALREYGVPSIITKKIPQSPSTEIESSPEGFNPPQEDMTSEKQRVSKLLENLDERLAAGEISEAIYNELKSKYSEKLRQIEEKIRSYERVDFSRLYNSLLAIAVEKYEKYLISDKDKLIRLISEILNVPQEDRYLTDENILRCAEILKVETPHKEED